MSKGAAADWQSVLRWERGSSEPREISQIPDAGLETHAPDHSRLGSLRCGGRFRGRQPRWGCGFFFIITQGSPRGLGQPWAVGWNPVGVLIPFLVQRYENTLALEGGALRRRSLKP